MVSTNTPNTPNQADHTTVLPRDAQYTQHTHTIPGTGAPLPRRAEYAGRPQPGQPAKPAKHTGDQYLPE